jgi:hypothetical protein
VGASDFQPRCRKDGAEIPVIADDLEASPPVVLSWCHWCKLGFVHVRDEGASWVFVAELRYDEPDARYVLRSNFLPRVGDSVRFDRKRVESLLPFLPPPPDRNRL